MKKKLIYSLFSIGLLSCITSCSDFLEVSSPSVVDADFVYKDLTTAQAAMAGVNESWRTCTANSTFAAGAYYALDAPGSDIEHHPEAYIAQPTRHYPEGFYENGTACSGYNIDTSDGLKAYTNLYATISLANYAISAIENRADYTEIVNSGIPSAWGFLYGQAVAARAASYLDLIRYFGDVPYIIYGGENASGLTSRDIIYEGELAKLELVEPLMYRPGETNASGNVVDKGIFTRTFVQGLIGRMCVYAGGYSTRRIDFSYTDLAGNSLSFEKLGADNNGSFYGRRADYATFYLIAKTYLDAAVANPGSKVKFYTEDPRATYGVKSASDGRYYGNPYQYFFQQLMENVTEAKYADESVYEIPMTRGNSNERPYSQGRVSNGGGTNAYPCKGYGQCRIQPAYYYGWFDNNDMRRDVTVTVSGSSGKGVELLIPFSPGSKTSAGGLCMNKFDENRQPDPYTKSQRNSGINGPFMRISDIYLLDAEVNAVLGNDGVAKGLLKKVHERAFLSVALAKTDEFVTNAGSLFKAIIKERALEFGGEGDRRNVLIRTGLLPEAIAEARAANEAMVAGLAANYSYTFENGNTISDYIWTVTGDAKTSLGYRLTTQCMDESNPYLFPGWRGQFDDWTSLGAAAVSGNKTNLAIKGLFQQYTPSKVEITYSDKSKETKIGLTFKEMMKLMMDGTASAIVEKDDGLGLAITPWAINLVKVANEYTTNFFTGYDSQKAPIYFYAINYNTIQKSNGKISNGYGFSQTTE